ncbi:Holliday junction branch migration protein RuvA [Fibrobacterota bacterium]
MYEYIRGILEVAEMEVAVIDVGGVGYEIAIPLSTFEALPRKGKTVKLFTHFHVREDTQKLFGFLTKAERDVFRKLITISKVGPKVALNVLSGLSIKDIVYSVQTQDASRLKAISGIGPKTAQRLVMELKGKLDVGDVDVSIPLKKGDKKVERDISVRSDAYAALISLGYNESQVISSLTRVEQAVDKDAPVEEWIKKALQVI